MSTPTDDDNPTIEPAPFQDVAAQDDDSLEPLPVPDDVDTVADEEEPGDESETDEETAEGAVQ